MFTIFGLANNFDVITVVETWVSDNISDREILRVGYKIIRRDRITEKRGGGVLLAVKDNTKTETFSFTSETLELATTVILSPEKNVLFGVCYRPPYSFKQFSMNCVDS